MSIIMNALKKVNLKGPSELLERVASGKRVDAKSPSSQASSRDKHAVQVVAPERTGESPAAIEKVIAEARKAPTWVQGLTLGALLVFSIMLMLGFGIRLAALSGIGNTKAALESFKLSGILMEEDGENLAVINGEMLRVGETINGARLSAVTSDYVEIDWQGRYYTLRLS